MKKKNLINADGSNMVMRKTIFALLLLIGFSGAFAVELFTTPTTEASIIQLHSIFNDTAGQTYLTTCSPLHIQIPYKQNFAETFLRIGYLPLCDVNQSDYVHEIDLYCNNNLMASWNVTDNCLNNVGYEYIEGRFDFANVTSIAFQDKYPSTLLSCNFCVNESSTLNRTDFWVRVENIGLRSVFAFYNETVITGSEVIENTFGKAVEFTYLVLSFAMSTAPIIFIVWGLFAIPLFFLFMLKRLVGAIKGSIPKK
jgi:hypothetical protein